MGPAGRLGLCLVLSALTRADPEGLRTCPHCPGTFCFNATHCGCPPGHRPPPWPYSPEADSCDDINECVEQPGLCGPGQSCTNTQGGFRCSCNPGYRQGPPPAAPRPAATPPGTPSPPAPLNCIDVDECAEGGEGLCGGGFVCFNTPGSFECHCAPGYAPAPAGRCAPMTVPPELCTHEQSGCALEENFTELYGRLRARGDPHHILQELVAVLDAAFRGARGGGRRRHPQATALLAATEGLVRGAGALLPPGTHSVPDGSGGTVLRLTVQQGPPTGPLRLQVPDVVLDVPGEVAWDSDTGLALVAALSQPGLQRVLEGGPQVRWEGWGSLPPPARPRSRPSYELLSPVATVFVTRPRPSGTPAVTLHLRHQCPSREGGRVLCAFWHPQEQLWATDGCREVTQPPGTPGTPGTPCSITCTCTHLTSFAVLLAFYEMEDDWVLDLVTRVGLGVSVGALVLAAATFLLCRALKGLRTTLHLHLSLSLLLAHGIFLLAIDRPQQPTLCAVAAGLLHFSFLAAFCWMCLEGLHLYVLLVRVFVPSWLRVRHLLLAGYGLPALLVTIAAAIFPKGYGTDRYCWLSLDRGFRWSFQGPVCLIIAVNAAILVITIWKLVQKFSDVNPDMGHLRKMRVLAATGAGQLCLLGTGWALALGVGVGLPPPEGAPSPRPPWPLLFLSCALNAAQGLFILLFHCLAHPQVREAYRAWLCPGAKRYSEFTSGTSNTSNTRLSRQQMYT